MQIRFSKYQGTGNDFILIDNRTGIFDKTNNKLIERLCNRRFGIGADGLMLLENKEGYDFEMVYYNADGNTSSMCGNGGRCIVEFARSLNVVENKATFLAIDGKHEATIKDNWVSLHMNDVKNVEHTNDFYYLNTGSPHYVTKVKDLAHYDVFNNGKGIRYNERFKEVGTNVNFIEPLDDRLFVRTYERGVEDETLSCGTGVTAAALAASMMGLTKSADHCDIKTLGGELRIKFKKHSDNTFSDVWLEGPATFVFEGVIKV